MVKILALAPFILVVMVVACGGGASPTAGVTSGAQEAPEVAPVPGAFNVDIKDFTHQDIKVPVGTTVAWTNRDPVRHTTTEDSDPEIWDSKSLEAGESFRFTFTEPGIFNYFCAIHPTMRATVTVTSEPTPTMTPTREAAPSSETESSATVAPPVATADANLEIVDFSHQSLTVAAGTTVTWANAGATIHTTTSNGDIWDSGVLESGQTFNFTFTEAGSFAYFCAIHPSMKATITVTGPPGAQSAPTTAAAPTSAPMPTSTATPRTDSMPTPKAAGTHTPEAQPTSAPAPQAEQGPPTANANMRDFKHQDLTVPVGTTVVWTNRDAVQHTVTSGSPSDPDPGSLFDSGADIADWVVQEEKYSHLFNEAGVFPYYCRVHGGSMSGTVTVTAASPRAVESTPVPTAAPPPTATIEPAPTLAPQPEPPTAAAKAALIQNFRHQDVKVSLGATVVWTNRDGSGHTTTAEQGQWDSGRLQQGQSFGFTFTEAGVFS